MRTLRMMVTAFGLAVLFGAPAMAAEGAGAAKEPSESLNKQASIANELALYDQQATAIADMAIERSQTPQVVEYARSMKVAHEKNLTALRTWAVSKKVEIASIDLKVPPRGTGGAGMSAEEKKAFDEKLSKYGSELREDAKEAQDDIFDLAKAPSGSFDTKFLSMAAELQEDQVDQAKEAQAKFAADKTFASLMSDTQATFVPLKDKANTLEEQLKK